MPRGWGSARVAGGSGAGRPRRRTGAASTSTAGSAWARPTCSRRLWHEADGDKAFGTFVEYTNLVGALGFQPTVEALSGHQLVCIDEFELDDPGDTVLMATLLSRLAGAGVSLAATSQHAPRRAGAGSVRRRGLPARDPGALGAVRGADRRRSRLPPPRRRGQPAAVHRGRGAGGRRPRGWRARPLRRRDPAPRAGAPEPLPRPARRRHRRRVDPRPARHRPGGRAAAGRPRRPALRRGHPVFASGLPLGELFSPRCWPAATARSTTGRSLLRTGPAPARSRADGPWRGGHATVPSRA